LLIEQTGKLKSELFDHIMPVKQFYNLISQTREVQHNYINRSSVSLFRTQLI